jgi:hypothetical protein
MHVCVYADEEDEKEAEDHLYAEEGSFSRGASLGLRRPTNRTTPFHYSSTQVSVCVLCGVRESLLVCTYVHTYILVHKYIYTHTHTLIRTHTQLYSCASVISAWATGLQNRGCVFFLSKPKADVINKAVRLNACV